MQVRSMRQKLLAALSLFLAVGCGAGYAAPSTGAIPSQAQVVTGTCREYDLGAGTLDIVTGVSFALRTMLFKTHDGTEILMGGRRVSLADMRANFVVQVEYRSTSQGNLADRITVLMDARGLRSP